MTQMDHEHFKRQGNEAYQKGEFRSAINFFSRGLEVSTNKLSDYLLFSNRSAAYCQLGDYQRALVDAELVIQMKPDWKKGYSRKAQALQLMQKYGRAIRAYKQGLALDPENEAMQKGLNECKEWKAMLQSGKSWDSAVKEGTVEELEKQKILPLWKEVIWHLQVTKERIWLEDGPRPPFRPKSLFLIDTVKLQIVNVAPHCARDTVTLDEILQFFVASFDKHGIRPCTVEVDDARLAQLLTQHMGLVGINVDLVATSEAKRQFLHDTFTFFDEQERQQWQNDPQYTGVLQQRAQPGMLAVPGVTLDALRAMYAAANHFVRSKVFLYFTQGLCIKVEGPRRWDARVALVIRNAKGQYGLAMATLQDSLDPLHYGTQAVMFVDLNELPFDDSDIFEEQGWRPVEGKYPYPIVFTQAEEVMLRPSAEDVMWYEVAFRAVTLFVQNTFAKPTFSPQADQPYCCRCILRTSQGFQDVVVSVPSDLDAKPTETFHEPIRRRRPATPKESDPEDDGTYSDSASSLDSATAVSDDGNVHEDDLGPVDDEFDPSNARFPSEPSLTLEPPAQNVSWESEVARAPITVVPSLPNPVKKEASQNNVATEAPITKVERVETAAKPEIIAPAAAKVQVQPVEHRAPSLQQQPAARGVQEANSLQQKKDLNENTRLSYETERAALRDLQDAYDKVQFQASLISQQAALIESLQAQLREGQATMERQRARIGELERLQLKLLQDVEAKNASELREAKSILSQLQASAETLSKKNEDNLQLITNAMTSSLERLAEKKVPVPVPVPAVLPDSNPPHPVRTLSFATAVSPPIVARSTSVAAPFHLQAAWPPSAQPEDRLPLRGPTAVSHIHPTAPPVTEVATAQPSAWEPIHLSPELKRTILRSEPWGKSSQSRSLSMPMSFSASAIRDAAAPTPGLPLLGGTPAVQYSAGPPIVVNTGSSLSAYPRPVQSLSTGAATTYGPPLGSLEPFSLSSGAPGYSSPVRSSAGRVTSHIRTSSQPPRRTLGLLGDSAQVVSDIVCNRRLSDSSYRTSLPRAPPDVFGDHTSQFSEGFFSRTVNVGNDEALHSGIYRSGPWQSRPVDLPVTHTTTRSYYIHH